uniref:Protein kinase domain-containing protein n=1 Tax=Brassica oleracea var. oleracea TaxID=109376 RepID=A0A0D3CBX7_BRAOL
MSMKYMVTGDFLVSLMYQLCKSMAFCHGHGVLTQDLKPQNLLMDRNTMTLKIADPWISQTEPFTLPMKKYTHELPEVLLGATHYSSAVDIWSVGCIFAELVNKHVIFAGDSELLRIFRLLGTPNEPSVAWSEHTQDWHEYPQWKPLSLSTAVPNLDEAGLDLLSKMLVYEPAKRISVKKAMEHPYFDDLPQKSSL